MAKYEVKDINKNGKIDDWEQAKYDAINKSSAANMNYDSPATMVGGVLASLAGLGQQPGTANYGGLLAQQQANQMAQSPINPVALGGLQNKLPNIVGQSIPGSFDKACPTPLTKKGCKYKK